MKAMVLEHLGKPLALRETACPVPQEGQALLRVEACGVCRTDLHILDAELPTPKLPLILGHQVVGRIEKLGGPNSLYKVGDRVGVPWLGKSCANCPFCLEDRENLCDAPTFTGYTQNGGYAEYCTAYEEALLPLPASYGSTEAAPLLCAGLIGYRALRIAAPKKTLGLYGFGSSAHLIAQVGKHLSLDVYVFTRPGELEKQAFARKLGAVWAGGSDEAPPEPLDSCILFAPLGELYPAALKAVKKGGRVVSAGIHMSDIPSFPYSLLWEERVMTSVANLTREDGRCFMDLLQNLSLQVKTTVFPLEQANEALALLREGTLEGSLVLKI